MRADGVVYYLHSDHLGSTSLVTNQGQGVVAQQGYYPYGASRWNVGTLPTDFTFTGQREDDSTGLMFYRARYYHAVLGRLISADTIVPSPGNPQSLNRYAYALNNPLKYTDPTGHMVRSDVDESGCNTPGSPACIIHQYYAASTDSAWMESRDLLAWLQAYPGYNAETDPYLEGPGKTIVAGVNWRTAVNSGDWGGIVGGGVTLALLGGMGPMGGPMPTELGPLGDGIPASSLAKDRLGDPDCVGCGYVAPSVQRLDPNAIGSWGARQVGEQLPVEVGQFPVAGRQRVYDGRFNGTVDSYVEIKTSTNGVVKLNPDIRRQIAFDANMDSKPMWIFVNARPSSGLLNLLRQNNIPFHQLNVTPGHR